MKIAAESLGGLELALSKAQAAARAAEGDFGLSAGDIHRIAERLPPDHSAIVVLVREPLGAKIQGRRSQVLARPVRG
jgi:uncharacterized membrane protein